MANESSDHALFWCGEARKAWGWTRFDSLFDDWKNVSVMDVFCNILSKRSTSSPIVTNADWFAPPPGLLKLNTAEAIHNDSRTIGLGAANRDDKGKVIVARSRLIFGSFNSEIGNLLALQEGLLLAKFSNCMVNVAEDDSSYVASILNSFSP
ncbi:hypothetical protein Ddye_028113 [Dipteronia dyeriana]|uniref:RNase H type-1 domain-containing protein n=1 Tax=Dipteronia dyeriana TaxID=168575 RepID=A0AAD9TQW6_9ROSI|nr:hypothetical protein Ddye_028113 [Dipteronia dyeriana]